MKETLIVIPYCARGAQGRELEFAVAGWRRHFKSPYRIVLAGADHPISKTGSDICCVRSPRVQGRKGSWRPHLDYVSCLRKVREAFPDTDGFVMVADDCYAVHDFDIHDIMVPKFIGEVGEAYNPANGWSVDKHRTMVALKEQGLPILNYTTHLPQWYEWDKLAALWDKYKMDEVSMNMEDLYYNTYQRDRVALNVHRQDVPYKCGLYAQGYTEDILRYAAQERVWITNSPEGWSDVLAKFLREYYGI